MCAHFPVDQIKPDSQQLLKEIRNFMFNPKSDQIYEN